MRCGVVHKRAVAIGKCLPVRPSVRPSVCHRPVLCRNGVTYCRKRKFVVSIPEHELTHTDCASAGIQSISRVKFLSVSVKTHIFNYYTVSQKSSTSYFAEYFRAGLTDCKNINGYIVRDNL